MQYENLPLFIPLLATVYLLAVYGVLKVAELAGANKPISANHAEKASN